MSRVTEMYKLAKEAYAEIGVDTDAAIALADKTPISIHCWQGDDVLGFEGAGGALTGGIQTTGNYPGRARTLEELRADLGKALSLIPGESKVNIHANYIDNGGKFVDRDEIETSHYASWADWAIDQGIGLDFNSTMFSHAKSEGGTLTNADNAIRDFWIEHAIRARKVSEFFGKKTGKTCVTNHWIPDGDKEVPIDTMAPRLRLKDSLDRIFAVKSPADLNKDAVESKLFGIGSESYVPGSHEFYMGYTMKNPEILLTLDAGHFHPTEVISGKISSILCFAQEILLHVSRPVRWDSDHVVLLDDETRQIMREIIRNDALDRVNIATDYFDASINRIAAWIIGSRNSRKALLAALLEPTAALKDLENKKDFAGRLAIGQEQLTMPMGAVWDYYCETKGLAVGGKWLDEVRSYEKDVLSKR